MPPCAEQLVLRPGEQLPCVQQPQGCFPADCRLSKQQGWPAAAHASHSVFAAQPAAHHTSARKPSHTPALGLKPLHVHCCIHKLQSAYTITCCPFDLSEQQDWAQSVVLMRHTCYSLVVEPCLIGPSSVHKAIPSISTYTSFASHFCTDRDLQCGTDCMTGPATSP